MDSSLLSVQLVVDEAGARLVVVGEVDLQTSPVLRTELEGAFETTDDRLVVDLTGVHYIDSTGLNALLVAASRYAEHGRSLTVVPSPQARRLFEIADSDHLLDHDGDAVSQRAASWSAAPCSPEAIEEGELDAVIAPVDR